MTYKCAFCDETMTGDEIVTSTWQQWQCPCCSKWNDKPPEVAPASGSAQICSRAIEQIRNALNMNVNDFPSLSSGERITVALATGQDRYLRMPFREMWQRIDEEHRALVLRYASMKD